ncbi:MAG: TonB-dependent receptor, partial [Candidatus Eisenbacteria bacterium]|nr:TonB-dependent receptor [Candidatus Eisenbacteria bacterium]
GYHVFRRDRFYNPEDEVGFDRWDSDDRTWTYGANLLARYDWHAARQSLSLMAESRRDRHIPESESPSIGVGFTRKRSETSLAIEDRAYLFGGDVELLGVYRWRESLDNYTGSPPFGAPPEPLDERHRTSFSGPSLGARWRLHPAASLRANWGRYARFPSMVELFGSSGYVEGNAELGPEEGTTTDVGLTVGFGDRAGGETFLQAVVFRAEREDLILFLQNSQRTVKAFNLEAARVEGFELSARRFWASGLGLSATYTYQDARNDGPSPIYNGNRLPYEPAHALFLRTEWERDRAALWHEYHYQGETYRDRANLEENERPASGIHNVGGGLELVPDALSVSLEVRNVTDERVTDVEGYPLPGRVFYVTLVVGAPERGSDPATGEELR